MTTKSATQYKNQQTVFLHKITTNTKTMGTFIRSQCEIVHGHDLPEEIK